MDQASDCNRLVRLLLVILYSSSLMSSITLSLQYHLDIVLLVKKCFNDAANFIAIALF